MSSEGLMSSAEGLVPSGPILYVSFGESELLCFQYNRTHTIHLAVHLAVSAKEQRKQMAKLELEIETLQEQLEEYRRGNKDKEGIKRLEDSITLVRTLLVQQSDRPDLVQPNTDLLQMDICSLSKGVLSWSSLLGEDVIEEAQNCETPLAVTERSKLCRHMWQTQVIRSSKKIKIFLKNMT